MGRRPKRGNCHICLKKCKNRLSPCNDFAHKDCMNEWLAQRKEDGFAEIRCPNPHCDKKPIFQANIPRSSRIVIADSKPCPVCGVLICKDGGCNNMVCQMCLSEFDYGTLRIIRRGNVERARKFRLEQWERKKFIWAVRREMWTNWKTHVLAIGLPLIIFLMLTALLPKLDRLTIVEHKSFESIQGFDKMLIQHLHPKEVYPEYWDQCSPLQQSIPIATTTNTQLQCEKMFSISKMHHSSHVSPYPLYLLALYAISFCMTEIVIAKKVNLRFPIDNVDIGFADVD